MKAIASSLTTMIFLSLQFSACRPLDLTTGQSQAGKLTRAGAGNYFSSDPSNPGAPITVMPLGDSNTYGYFSEGYRKSLDLRLQSQQILVQFVGEAADTRDPTYANHMHNGFPGWSTDDLTHGRPDSAYRPMDTVQNLRPDIILLMAGTNDFGVEHRTVAEAQANMTALLNEIRSRSPWSSVIVASIYPRVDISQNPRTYLSSSNDQVVAYNSWLAGEVNARKANGQLISFVDQYSSFDLNTSIDGIHADEHGCATAASVWQPEVAFITTIRRQVMQAYLDILNRPADEAGLIPLVNSMMNGLPYAQMRQQLSAGSTAPQSAPVIDPNYQIVAVDNSLDVANIQTTFTNLDTFHAACDRAVPLSVACSSAVNRFCVAHGWGGGGYGPVEYNGDATAVVCFSANAVALFKTTFTAAQAAHPACSAASPYGMGCNAAANRICAAGGNAGGFGPVEYLGNELIISCMAVAHTIYVEATFTELASYHPACSGSAFAMSGGCNAAINRDCAARGFVGGVGVLEFNGDNVGFACFH